MNEQNCGGKKEGIEIRGLKMEECVVKQERRKEDGRERKREHRL